MSGKAAGGNGGKLEGGKDVGGATVDGNGKVGAPVGAEMWATGGAEYAGFGV